MADFAAYEVAKASTWCANEFEICCDWIAGASSGGLGAWKTPIRTRCTPKESGCAYQAQRPEVPGLR